MDSMKLHYFGKVMGKNNSLKKQIMLGPWRRRVKGYEQLYSEVSGDKKTIVQLYVAIQGSQRWCSRVIQETRVRLALPKSSVVTERAVYTSIL